MGYDIGVWPAGRPDRGMAEGGADSPIPRFPSVLPRDKMSSVSGSGVRDLAFLMT